MARENAPEMSAWEAIIVASVAMMTIGNSAQLGTILKKILPSITLAPPIMYAPWPK